MLLLFCELRTVDFPHLIQHLRRLCFVDLTFIHALQRVVVHLAR